MAIGIGGGMLVAAGVVGMAPSSFWARVTEFVTMGDLAHGVSKSFVFAWIIGLAGSHFGMRAGEDASSVGAAATRTVVAGISMIILVDAIWATASSLWGEGP
jgi:phospholipid/cholesterol/gamma-HCH transport system permease protein